MKRPTKLGSRATVLRNIDEAQLVLGELGYMRFLPAPKFKVKNGLVALAASPTSLYPNVVLLRSRGSFLELRADEVFYPAIVNRLRKNLWVPIHVAEPFKKTELNDFIDYVDESEHGFLQEHMLPA